MPPIKPPKLTPFERKAQRAKITTARKRLGRAGLAPGIRAKIGAGLSSEEIARDVAELGDKLLAFDALVPGPVGVALEKFDGPILYAAALLLVKAIRRGMVKAGLIAG